MSTFDEILGITSGKIGDSEDTMGEATRWAESVAKRGGDKSQGNETAGGTQSNETIGETQSNEPTEKAKGDKTAGEAPSNGKNRMSYTDLYLKMNPYKPPTKDEVEREKRKQRQRSVFAAISDGISAMANIYNTSQYAPVSWNATGNMSKKTRERWERVRKEHEAEARTFWEGYLRARQLDDSAAISEWQRQHTLEQERNKNELNDRIMLIKEAKAERDAKIADLKEQLALKKISEQEYVNQIKHAEADYARAYQQSRIKKNNRTTTKSGNGSGKGAVKRYPIFNSDGDVIDHAYTRDEAVSETERNGGTYPGKTSSSTKSEGSLKKTTTRQSRPTANRKPRKKKNRLGL